MSNSISFDEAAFAMAAVSGMGIVEARSRLASLMFNHSYTQHYLGGANILYDMLDEQFAYIPPDAMDFDSGMEETFNALPARKDAR